MPGLAQAARQTAVDHGVLAIMQADAGTLVDQGLDAGKVAVGPDELAPLRQRTGHAARQRLIILLRPGRRGGE